MPFPLIPHQGLAAPALVVGRRQRLDAVAYMAGTLAPDLPFALDRTRWDFDAVSHDGLGLVLWCVPMVLLASWVFRSVVARTLAAHLPDGGPLRLRDVAWAAADRPAWWVTVVSGLLGALSHLVFDGFTHPEPWAVDLVPVLEDRAPVSLPHPGPPTYWYDIVYTAANYGGALALLACLYVGGRRRARTGRPRPQLPAPTARSWLGLGGSMAGGALVGVALAALAWGPETMAQGTMLFTWAVALGTVGGCLLVGRYPAAPMDISLDGWDIGRFDELEWVPWGEGGKARAKVLAAADGYTVALIEAEPGYEGTPHDHAFAEFLYVIDGTVRNQGREMKRGDGYAAAAGSAHTDFTTETGATYINIFKLG